MSTYQQSYPIRIPSSQVDSRLQTIETIEIKTFGRLPEGMISPESSILIEYLRAFYMSLHLGKKAFPCRKTKVASEGFSILTSFPR